MTTMTRMVDEQRVQIGVFKALGYANSQILGKYVLYSGSAAIIGSVLGYAVCSVCLPWVIWEIYGMMYNFAPLIYTFDPWLALVSFAAAMLCSVGVTWLACRVELTHPAASLIRPKAPRAGKRVFLEWITPLWSRLSFLQKVSVRNVLRYRSRLVMMLLGIGGCTALLITGFGLRDSVLSLAQIQFSQITHYDYGVTFRDPQTPDSLSDYLADCGWDADMGLLVCSENVDLVLDKGVKTVSMVIPTSDSLDGFVTLRDDSGILPFPGTGEAVISSGLCQTHNITVGDVLTLRDEDLRTVTVTVSGICENYMGDCVYLSAGTYRAQTGDEPVCKTLYLQAHEGADPVAESVKLSDGEKVVSVAVTATSLEQINSMLSRMDYVVVVVVLCAAALAFIVLYNLTNINISERIREIATIKVLGFYRSEVASYVFRETYILSALGSLVGLVLGKLLHMFVMAQVRIDGIYFPHLVTPISYAVSVALTLVFTVLIALFMRKKLGSIDMAESLKSVE